MVFAFIITMHLSLSLTTLPLHRNSCRMHAILSRPDFRDVVAWLPHGRSWRVLKPREFEIKIIPLFFEHAKFSSFVRQANGTFLSVVWL